MGGWVPSSVAQRIIEAPLVVVDLSHRNLNVFYELGIAQAYHRPHVIICDTNTADSLPFDIDQLRHDRYNRADVPSIEALVEPMASQMRGLCADPDQLVTPVTAVAPASRSGSSTEGLELETFRRLEALQGEIRSLRSELRDDRLQRLVSPSAFFQQPAPIAGLTGLVLPRPAVLGTLISVIDGEGNDVTARPHAAVNSLLAITTEWLDANGSLIASGVHPTVAKTLGEFESSTSSNHLGRTTQAYNTGPVPGDATIVIQVDRAQVQFGVRVTDS